MSSKEETPETTTKETTKKSTKKDTAKKETKKRTKSPSSDKERKKRPKGHVEVIPIPKNFSPAKEKRARKSVERFTESDSPKKEKKIVIRKGKGKKLVDCPNLESQIKKKRKSDETLRLLYTILFARPNKASPIKDHLLEFSGVVYEDDDDRDKLEQKIDRHSVSEIKSLLKFFGQEHDGKKEELVERLANFLEKPKASDVIYEEEKRKRSRSRSKSPRRRTKKDPDAPKRPLSSYMLFCKDHRAEVTKDHPEDSVTEIAKRLGALWKKVSKDDKKKYEKQHAKLKEKYEKEMESYKKKKPSKKSKKDSKDSDKSDKSDSEDESSSSEEETSTKEKDEK